MYCHTVLEQILLHVYWVTVNKKKEAEDKSKHLIRKHAQFCFVFFAKHIQIKSYSDYCPAIIVGSGNVSRIYKKKMQQEKLKHHYLDICYEKPNKFIGSTIYMIYLKSMTSIHSSKCKKLCYHGSHGLVGLKLDDLFINDQCILKRQRQVSLCKHTTKTCGCVICTKKKK